MSTACPRCLTENSSGSKFCRECATPLPDSESLDVTLQMTPDGGSSAPPGSPSEDFPPGTMFAGRFRIVEPLGGGGMGRVYKALDTKVGEKVALKRILPEIAADPDIRARFADELRLARRIAHPNVCRVFDIGEAEGAPFISMEYVAGEDLKNIIRMTGGLSPGQTASIGRQVAAGLEEAHRLGVVHRDLKPQNIMIDRDGVARIMDFGIARMDRPGTGRTGRGVMVGTPDYMSPEQAAGEAVDGRSDLYSLGVMLFEMATGRLPFEARTAVAMAVKHKTEPPPEPRTVNPRVPEDLSRLILRLLEKDREKRIPTASDVRAELERIEAEAPTAAPVRSRRATSTARQVAANFPLKKVLVLAGTILAVAAVVVLALRSLPGGGGRHAPKVPNSIAVVGFANLTGDPKYDHLRTAIPELLITNLENIGRMQVTTWERMQDVLKQHGPGIVGVIDAESGFEVCRQEGVAAIVTGSFTKAGNTFATNMKLLDAETRKLLKSASSQGEGENSILRTQIDELSKEIERGFFPSGPGGASGGTAVPVMDVTTNSIDAYAAFLRGRDEYERYRYNEAAADLERAVALDPAFASAHYYLGRIYRNMGDLKGTVEHFERAKSNAGKATDKERRWIEAGYAGYVERDSKKQIGILEEAVKVFPREKTVWLDLGNAFYANRLYEPAVAAYSKALGLDPAYGGALNQLAYCYLEMGRHDDAADCLKTYAKFYPEDVNPIDSLAEVEYSRGRLAEAEAGYKRVIAIDPAFGADMRLAWMQALQEKYVESLETLRAWTSRAATDVDRLSSLLLESIILHLAGRERESREALRAGRELAALSGTTDAADLVEGWIRFDLADWTGCRAAWGKLAGSGRSGPSSRIVMPVDPALLEAMLELAKGDAGAAKARSAVLENARALDGKPWQLAEDDLRQLISARILAAEGDESGARAILARDRPVPLLFMNAIDLIAYICPLEQDDLARLSARAGDGGRAIAEYRVLTVISPDHKNRRAVHPIYHFRLAQVFEQNGQKADAVKEYQRFLTILAKADAETPAMAEAKKKLASLTGG